MTAKKMIGMALGTRMFYNMGDQEIGNTGCITPSATKENDKVPQ